MLVIIKMPWKIIKEFNQNYNKNALLIYKTNCSASTWQQIYNNDKCMKELSKIILRVTKKPYIIQFNQFKKNKTCIVLVSEAPDLPKLPNYVRFNDKIDKQCKKNSKSIKFLSPSGTKLIVPCPRKKGKQLNAVNIKYFFKYGTSNEICDLWKNIFKNLKNGQYLCTHGYDVPWLHVRITKKVPKYYSNETLKNFKFIENICN